MEGTEALPNDVDKVLECIKETSGYLSESNGTLVRNSNKKPGIPMGVPG